MRQADQSMLLPQGLAIPLPDWGDVAQTQPGDVQ